MNRTLLLRQEDELRRTIQKESKGQLAQAYRLGRKDANVELSEALKSK